MLLLDMVSSNLILILRFEIFETYSNDNLRWRRVWLDQKSLTWIIS